MCLPKFHLQVCVGDQEADVVPFYRFSPENHEMFCSLSKEASKLPTEQLPGLASARGFHCSVYKRLFIHLFENRFHKDSKSCTLVCFWWKQFTCLYYVFTCVYIHLNTYIHIIYISYVHIYIYSLLQSETDPVQIPLTVCVCVNWLRGFISWSQNAELSG